MYESRKDIQKVNRTVQRKSNNKTGSYLEDNRSKTSSTSQLKKVTTNNATFQRVMIKGSKGKKMAVPSLKKKLKAHKKLTLKMRAEVLRRHKLKKHYILKNTIDGLTSGRITPREESTTRYGNSYALGRSRYKLSPKALSFKIWKRGREAQHLIPAAVCKHFEIPRDWANSHPNGMMMPSGRTGTNHLRDKTLDKGKLHHIKFGGAHPQYNKLVQRMALKRKWVPGKVKYAQFLNLCLKLRTMNRPRRKGKAKGYVNDL